jgi:hypothetical protein
MAWLIEPAKNGRTRLAVLFLDKPQLSRVRLHYFSSRTVRLRVNVDGGAVDEVEDRVRITSTV